MRIALPLASGDAGLVALLAGGLVLVGAALALSIAGIILLKGKSSEQNRIGKRMLWSAIVPLAIGAVWWLAFVGFD